MRREKYDLGPMPQIIAQVQQAGMTGGKWAEKLDQGMAELLERILPGEGLLFLHLWRISPVGDPGMLRRLDEVILRQAKTIGVRLLLSRIVQKRTIEWHDEPDGPGKFEALGKAFAHATLIFQGRILPPLDDPQLYLSKLETVRELTKLQKKMLEKSVPQEAPELRNFFFAAIVGGKRRFVALIRNLERWKAFFEQRENLPLLLSFAQRDGGPQVTPVQLFDAWMAWCKGAARGEPMDPETVRKRISTMGKYC